MGLGLADGGHLTHGAYTPKRKISASSIYFQSLPYQVDPATGLIDYDLLEKNALLFKPRILICGASAYPRDFDYARLRKIADLNGSYLMSVHSLGPVAPLTGTDARYYSQDGHGSHLGSRRCPGPQGPLLRLRRRLHHHVRLHSLPATRALVLTTPRTSHKTLRGPRAGLIFFRTDKENDMAKRINDAVFPACQGGPHNNVRLAVSTCRGLSSD
jgi:glycine hydroxymethyltransferase